MISLYTGKWTGTWNQELWLDDRFFFKKSPEKMQVCFAGK